MEINFHLLYQDKSGREEHFTKDVDYIPDYIFYKDQWWNKNTSVIDFDTGKYTKVNYKQVFRLFNEVAPDK